VVVLEGIRFLPNSNWRLGSQRIDSEQVQVFGAQYGRLEDVYITSWGSQVSERQVLRNVEIVGRSEPDAQIWEVLIEDSNLGHLGGPNGPTNMMVRRTTFREDIRLGMGRFVCEDCDFTKWQSTGGAWTLFTMDHLGPTAEVEVTNSRFWASGSGSKPVFGGTPYRDAIVGSHVTYAAGPPSVVTIPFPGGNPSSTLWSWLTAQVGDQGTGRVMYMQGGTPRWGTIIRTRAIAGPNSASALEIAWDPGAGRGIASGTVMRFYKIRDLSFQNVTFNGWTNESEIGGGQAHNCANHQAYVLAGQSIPRSVWDVTMAS
jgi:hypothetical protein